MKGHTLILFLLVLLCSPLVLAEKTSKASASTNTVPDDSTRNSIYAIYDRLAAYNYAQKYWDAVCSDGYFVNTRTTYIPLDPGTDITGMTGYDCAHFVSCCIGNEPNEPGGGLDVPITAPHIYGELGSTQLGDWLVASGIGVEKATISDLMMGDVINYDWNGDGHWDHVALYLGNGEVAGHTTCVWEVDWQLIGAADYRFIRILASPWIVDDDGSADFQTIQAAINAAGEGDTIFVRNGTYYENVVVNKSASLIGESAIIEGNSTGTGIVVVANGVSIQGFAITGDDIGIDYGIHLNGALNCTISENQILPFLEGILLSNGSDRNRIYGNTIQHQAEGEFAISLFDSNHNKIWGNQGGWNGIKLSRASHNIISGQDIGGLCSLYLISSFNNTISDNRMDSPNSIVLRESHNNTICRNEIHGGVYLTNASNNRFYHNNMEAYHIVQNETPNSTNIWDNGCEGNYWSDYVARYPNASYDQYGIWNTSYEIYSTDLDHYPLRSLYWNPADVNHDLSVDIFDITLAAACYSLDWQDHMCHVDLVEPYGVVNIFDIVLMADSYGEEYHGP